MSDIDTWCWELRPRIEFQSLTLQADFTYSTSLAGDPILAYDELQPIFTMSEITTKGSKICEVSKSNKLTDICLVNCFSCLHKEIYYQSHYEFYVPVNYELINITNTTEIWRLFLFLCFIFEGYKNFCNNVTYT